MSKDDWPSYRASDAFEDKLTYQQARYESDIAHITKTTLYDTSPTYRPYRVISQELDYDSRTYRRKRDAVADFQRIANSGKWVVLQKGVSYKHYTILEEANKPGGASTIEEEYMSIRSLYKQELS